MQTSFSFIADGCCRAETAILAEVTAKYADELRAASFWKRRRIRRKIYEEAQQRLEKEAPPDALY